MDGPLPSGTRAIVVRLHAPDCALRSDDPALRRPVVSPTHLAHWSARGIAVVAVADGAVDEPALFDLEAVVEVHRRVHHHLGRCDTVVTGPTVGAACGCRHPRPQLFRAAAHAAGVAVGSCLALLDGLADLEAARAAGLTALRVGSDRDCDLLAVPSPGVRG